MSPKKALIRTLLDRYRNIASDFDLARAGIWTPARAEGKLVLKLSRALMLAGCAAPLWAQYAGPAILTRGEAPAAMATPQISFRPFFELGAVYDTGLAGVAVNSQGELGGVASFGISLSGGVSGARSWKHTKVGLDYRGSLNHYNKSTYYDSTNQSLMLGITHQFTRHTSLSLRESAGMFSRDFGLLGLPATVPFDPATAGIPTTDFYDNRTVYLSTQADYTIQKSYRLSFNFGGDGLLVRRRSTALYGVSGGGARADVHYRMSRRSTIGAAYLYTHYGFHGIFSSTDLHSVVGTYGIRITRNLEMTAYAGVLRAETKFAQSVPIDPAVAALLGVQSAAAIAYRVDYVPNISGRLSRTFPRGVAYVSGGRSITPGNGLFLTSTMTNATAGYTYTGLRRWSFNAQAGYDRADSVGNYIGQYGDVSGTLSMSRQIGRSIHAVASFAARKYQSGDFSKYNRLIYMATIGIGFAPGDVPLRIW